MMVAMPVEYLPPELEDVLWLDELPKRPLTVEDLEQIWERMPDSRYDQTRKKQVYAEFGIPDYWINHAGRGQARCHRVPASRDGFRAGGVRQGQIDVHRDAPVPGLVHP